MNNSVDQYMATDLVCFSPDDDIIDAMRVLLKKRISGAPVLDESGGIVGILSKKDCLKILYDTAYHQHWGGKVAQYMSVDVEHLDADCSLIDAAEKFLQSSFRRFPVLRNGKLVGQISRHDLLHAIDEVYLQPPR